MGKRGGETDRTLRNRHPGGRVAAIGIAGENLVQMACIMHDVTRSAGRPGLGAVMGSKNLKAIIVHGTEDKPLHDRARFQSERTAYVRAMFDKAARDFGEYGTVGGLTWLSERGILPTKNFQEGTFDRAEEIGENASMTRSSSTARRAPGVRSGASGSSEPNTPGGRSIPCSAGRSTRRRPRSALCA